MKKSLLSLLLIIIGILIGIFISEKFLFTKQVGDMNNTPKRLSLVELARQKEPYKCLLSAKIRPGEFTPITLYTYNGVIGGEYSFIDNNKTDTAYFVANNNDTYAWNTWGANLGIIFKNSPDTNTPDLSKSPILEQILDYVCEPWNLDTSKFEIPTSTIQFAREIG